MPKKIYLMKTCNNGQEAVDSTVLSRYGEFEFRYHAKYPDLYQLKVDSLAFDLIAENGDAIRFSTSISDQFHNYNINGSGESLKLKEFMELSKVYQAKTDELNTSFIDKSSRLEHIPDSLTKAYMLASRDNRENYLSKVLSFMDNNQHSLAGFYAAQTLDATRFEQRLIRYTDNLRGDIKSNPEVIRFVKAMDSARLLSIDGQAPAFAIAGMDNRTIRLSDYKGKYVMIDFWASWCVPCRQENPNILTQFNRFRASGLEILGISLDDDKNDWKRAVVQDKLAWAHASELKGFAGEMEQLYHVEGIPSNFIIDPQGKIIAKNLRGNELAVFLEKTFDQLKRN